MLDRKAAMVVLQSLNDRRLELVIEFAHLRAEEDFSLNRLHVLSRQVNVVGRIQEIDEEMRKLADALVRQ